jgi:hypothetical protein
MLAARRAGGDKKDQSAAAGAGERCADREALARAEMAIDYAPAFKGGQRLALSGLDR